MSGTSILDVIAARTASISPVISQVPGSSQQDDGRVSALPNTNRQIARRQLDSRVTALNRYAHQTVSESMQRLYTATAVHNRSKSGSADEASRNLLRDGAMNFAGINRLGLTSGEWLAGTLPNTERGADTNSDPERGRLNRGSHVSKTEASLVNYSPTVVINCADSQMLEQRILAVMSEHGYELTELLAREALKHRRTIF
jgi:hypothetical protein